MERASNLRYDRFIVKVKDFSPVNNGFNYSLQPHKKLKLDVNILSFKVNN